MVNPGLKRQKCALAARFDAIGPSPAEAVLGTAARAIFAADPFTVTEPIDLGKDEGVVYLALLVRLAPHRHLRTLDVADDLLVLPEALDQIAADDLHMVEIVLQPQVRLADLGNDVGAVLDLGQEIARLIGSI